MLLAEQKRKQQTGLITKHESSYEPLMHTGADPNGKFKLLKYIGSGAHAKIYIGEELANPGKLLAIKVLPIDKGNEDIILKLGRELDMMKNCALCPNVVKFYSHFIEETTRGNRKLWIIMEYCDCGSLANFMESTNRSFTENQIAFICRQVLRSLEFLQGRGVAHRDIKSANLLWNSSGEVKLADFGEASDLYHTLSPGELLVGTPYFIAPEIILATEGDTKYTPKVDIWSLGITAIELAEKQPPFFGQFPVRIVYQIAKRELVPGLRNPEAFSPEFRDFISKCLIYDPEQRWSATQLLQHPFIQKASVKYILEAVKVLKDCKNENGKEEPRVQTTRLVTTDKLTGETMPEFIKRMLEWRESKMPIISKITDSATTAPLLERKSSKFKNMMKSMMKDRSLEKDIERWELLVELAQFASSDFGVLEDDRSIQETYYENCFIGKELVDWIYENMQFESRNIATQLAIHLAISGLIEGVPQGNLNIDSMEDIFRFNREKIREWAVIVTEKVKRMSMNNKLDKKKSGSDAQLVKEMELTERDWSLILLGAKIEIYQKSDVIVKQGCLNRCIYRIKKGSARVEKVGVGNPFTFNVLNTMGVGQMFGEMSVVTSTPTSATIIADETPTEIYSTDVHFMYKLFSQEPSLTQRFYLNTACKLAKKLAELGKNAPKEIFKKKEDEDDDFVDPVAQRDKSFCKLFDFAPEELVIQDYACHLKGIIREHGTLFISSNFVCFYAKIFGKKTKIRMKIRKLIKIKSSCMHELTLKTKRKKMKLGGLVDVKAIIEMLESIKECRYRTSSSREITRKNRKWTVSVDIADEEIISSDDWHILLKESKCILFRKNDIIVNEGDWATSIYQIGKGRCRAEKMVEGKSHILGTMETGEIFGEIGLLQGLKTTASVVADEDEVEIYVVEGAILRLLFFRIPALAGRWFKYLTFVLSRRLKEREKSHGAQK